MQYLESRFSEIKVPVSAINDSALPAVNASLNAASAVLLGAGYVFIRRRRIPQHVACMVAATIVSATFLACYVWYHLHYPPVSTRSSGIAAWARYGYLALLFSHVLLAIVNLPMIVMTLFRAVTGRFDLHPRIARPTLAVWLYVSITGVIVYAILYHLFPAWNA